MAGDVEAEHGVFAGEAFLLTPGGSLAQFEWRRCRSGSGTEQAVLTAFARPRSTLQGGNGVIYGSEHGFARAERIHGA